MIKSDKTPGRHVKNTTGDHSDYTDVSRVNPGLVDYWNENVDPRPTIDPLESRGETLEGGTPETSSPSDRLEGHRPKILSFYSTVRETPDPGFVHIIGKT